MDIAQVFADLSQHMVQGIMFHEDMVDYYNFLNLPGYAACHCWRAKSESKARRQLRAWYVRHCGRLVLRHSNSAKEYIPSGWYSYTQSDVSPSDIRKAVKEGLEQWVQWEEKTKALYERGYRDLTEAGYIDAACFVKELILDVSEELASARQYQLTKNACDYNIEAILCEQEKDQERFEKE